MCKELPVLLVVYTRRRDGLPGVKESEDGPGGGRGGLEVSPHFHKGVN